MQTKTPSVDRRNLLKLGISAAAISVYPAAAQQGKSTGVSHRQVASKVLFTGIEGTIVETESGKVRGYRRGETFTFKGIPYGAPTSSKNRFAAPLKPQPWTGVRSCLSWGPTTPDGFGIIEPDSRPPWGDQDAFVLYRGYERSLGSEDCLRLNIWTPQTGSGRRAVMVYMHGGGFSGGSGNDLQCYDGAALAESQNVVVVTHNHRLNAFGFLDLTDIDAERFKDSANAGMLDNLAVLQWVKSNIAQFGGDPNRVMIFGQSGGGGKVNCLMAMPGAKGLFHSAAVQSGSILRVAEQQDSQRVAAAFLKEIGISRSNASNLESVSTQDIVAAASRAIAKLVPPPGSRGLPSFRGPLPGWSPTLDGINIPVHPCDPRSPEFSADVPIIVGTNQHEFVNGVDNPEVDSLTEDEVVQRLQHVHVEDAARVLTAYKKVHPKSNAFGLWADIAASGVRSAAFTQSLRKSELRRAPAYAYVYAWRTPVLTGKLGTFHSAEITMVFNNAASCDRYTGGGAEALRLSAQMSSAWAALAKSGSPQHPELPVWPAYESSRKASMRFDGDCKVEHDYEGEGLALLSR